MKTIYLFICFVLITSLCWSEDKDLKVFSADIEFYGKVIDQNGDPVEGAEIPVQIPKLKLHILGGIQYEVKEVVVKSDKNGNFEVKNENGSEMSIYKIIRKGYEILPEYAVKDIYYSPDSPKRYIPDPSNPLIFKMRKKEPPAFVIPGKFNLTLKQAGTEREVDFVERSAEEAGKLGTSKYRRDEHVDLRIKATLSEDKTNYIITFTTPDDNSGTIEREELLYVAPEEGYVSPRTITVPVDIKKGKKYLYVKSRQGKVYARLDIEINSSKEEIGVSVKSWANPTGSRNVDFDEEFYAQERRRANEESDRKAIEREELKKKKWPELYKDN